MVMRGIWFAFAPTSLVFGFAPTERCGRGKCEPAVGANANDMFFLRGRRRKCRGQNTSEIGTQLQKSRSRVLRMSRTHQEDVNFVAFRVFSIFPRRDLDRAKNADCLASSKQKLPT